MRKVAVLAALVAAVAISCCHLISAYSFDSFESDNEPAWSWDRRTPWFGYEFPFYNFWPYFGREPRFNNFDVSDMVHDIIDGMDNPAKIEEMDDDFDSDLTRSISDTLEKNMKDAKELEEKIIFETKKMQEKTNKQQAALLEGKNGQTLVVIECLNQEKQYIIKNGKWYKCKDTLSTTEKPNCQSELVECAPDVCAYNSIIKYHVDRDLANSSYTEPGVVCLIKGCSDSVKQFSGVSENTVNQTCVKGDILSLSAFNDKCGVEQKISYFYWPKKGGGCSTHTINWKVSERGISHSSSSGGGSGSSSSTSTGSDDNYSVVSSSLSSFAKK